MKITLINGEKLYFSEPKTVLEIADSISGGLKVKCVGALVNSDYVVSSYTLIDKNCKLEIITERNKLYYQAINYTAKLVTIFALMELYPDLDSIVQDGINSELEFSVFHNSKKIIKEEDLDKIEQRANEIIERDYKIVLFKESREYFIKEYRKLKVKGNYEKFIQIIEKKYITFPILKMNGEAFFAICATLKSSKDLYKIKLTRLEKVFINNVDNTLIEVQQIFGIAAENEPKLLNIMNQLKNKF
ncbi:TGS domain-containing protein [Spiroplasma diminutum]|uniref:TGS domain-containing protein n=1 Tax=Spiroplasma diminutum CUAS-1 TaxID=1276221 RepID=S5M1K0_9MOLU|nr:TGS domain-containing protein [Spiroplasma diminutum]AGR41932.1 hypothetical protein SDIMI_v3c02280 [Spiroplasma diminutum CUAS-1]